jgi:very-short-patch-repair endonuclease
VAEPLRYHHRSIKQAQTFRKHMTDAEQKLWSQLRRNWLGYYFRRQVPIGKYIVDFMCWKKKLIVEIDGSQHYTTEGKEYDRIRDTFLEGQGFHVLRFNSSETLQYTDAVLEKIFETLQNPISLI